MFYFKKPLVKFYIIGFAVGCVVEIFSVVCINLCLDGNVLCVD